MKNKRITNFLMILVLSILIFASINLSAAYAKGIYLKCISKIDSSNIRGTISVSEYDFVLDKKKNLHVVKLESYLLKKESNYTLKEYGLLGKPVTWKFGSNYSKLQSQDETFYYYGKKYNDKKPYRLEKLNKFTLELHTDLYDYEGIGTKTRNLNKIVFNGTVIKKCKKIESKI